MTWRFEDIVDAYMILDEKLSDDTEVHSAFMNYRFYQSLANKGQIGVWQAYLKAHPRANPSRVTVGRVLDWSARRSSKNATRLNRLAPPVGRSLGARRRPVR